MKIVYTSRKDCYHHASSLLKQNDLTPHTRYADISADDTITRVCERYVVIALNIVKRSICEHLSAFCSSASEYLTAVLGSHSLSETVLFLSLELLGLISSFHYLSSLLALFLIKREIHTDTKRVTSDFSH